MTMGFPLADAIGLEVVEIADGRAVMKTELGEWHKNPHGSAHGGVLFTMVDTSMGAASMSVLSEGEMCASIEVHIRFIRPVFEGLVSTTTTVVHKGKRVIHLESSVVDSKEKVVATATGSFAVIARPKD